MKKRLVLTAAITIFVASAVYIIWNPNNYPKGKKPDFIQTESITAPESDLAGQQLEIKMDKILYQLEQRQFDETVYDDETMERILSYIESFPEDSVVVPDIESELRREWLKKAAIFYITAVDDETIIINEYLKQQGISKTIPDNITYCNEHPLIKYYIDDKSGKIAFVATIADNSSRKFVYCVVAYSEDLKKEGSFVYDFDQDGKLLSERFYNNQDEQTTAISYTYKINIPFPIITEYENSFGEESCFFTNIYFNTGQRFWVYDSLLEFDESDKWIKYNGDIYNDFYPGNDIESYNIPVYSEEGRLEKIVETLKGSRYQDDPEEWIEDGEISFTYSSSGSLAEVSYHGFSGNHGSSGNVGYIYYDENGRIVHIDTFHSSGNYHRFYLYQDNEKYPFAIFKIGGMPYSGDEFDGYDIYFGMDSNVWFFLDE